MLRTHRDVIRGDGGGDGGKDGEAHGLLEIGLREDERVHAVEVLRGGVTVHNEWIVHGSGGNETDGWRHTYVCAFRDERMVAYERARGFRHVTTTPRRSRGCATTRSSASQPQPSDN